LNITIPTGGDVRDHPSRLSEHLGGIDYTSAVPPNDHAGLPAGLNEL
jgi:hypothetical protein